MDADMMRVSGFTFLRNGVLLGYPFEESIRSVLPICDEFVVNVGESEDDTLDRVRAIDSPKIRIVETRWNDNMTTKGFMYGQQKMIAQFNCTGHWAFYLEGDEVVHEDDLPAIENAMRKHLDNGAVEALIFDYIHFYGNGSTYVWSPGWYRTAPRIIRNTIRAIAPGGLYWVVLNRNKSGRYPVAAHTGAKIFHYGWARTEDQMNLKSQQVQKFWTKEHRHLDLAEIDPFILRKFEGTHPRAIQDWLRKSDGLFQVNPDHKLTRKEKKHRLMLKLEAWFGLELSKKHYRLVK